MKYLSPTQLSLWQQNQEEYFLKYLAVDKPPKFAQTQPMSVGSSFDAYVKSYLARALGVMKPELEFEALFEKQVEPHNRDWAKRAGLHCFHVYEKCGALASLQKLLMVSKSVPQFETTERSSGVKVKEGLEVVKPENNGVPELLGKPDLYFGVENISVTLDWKVNGYCSNSPKSPTKGYIEVYSYEGGQSGAHKDAYVVREEKLSGLLVNALPNLEQCEKEWAKQLTTYSWLTGAEVGQEIIVIVDQLCCSMTKPINGNPNIRVARHACRITPEFQIQTYNGYQELWNRIYSDHFFRDKSKEDSKARAEILSQQGAAFRGEEPKDDWYRKMTGRV